MKCCNAHLSSLCLCIQVLDMRFVSPFVCCCSRLSLFTPVWRGILGHDVCFLQPVEKRLMFVDFLSSYTVYIYYFLSVFSFVSLCMCVCVMLQVWSNFQAVFSPEYRRTTYMMMAVWFSMSFR